MTDTPIDKDSAEDGMGSVRFLDITFNDGATFEYYLADSAQDAICFLDKSNIAEKSYYKVVHTPEGTWGRDAEGLYLERLLPFQRNTLDTNCEGVINGIPSMFSLGMAAKGLTDNFVVNVKCGMCQHVWLDGLRYKGHTVVKCPECKSLNLVDSSPLNYST